MNDLPVHSRMIALMKTIAQSEQKEHAGAILIATAIAQGLGDIAKQVQSAISQWQQSRFNQPK